MGAAQGVGPDHAHLVRMNITQALAKALEASNGPCGDFAIEPALLVHARAQPHALAEPIDDDQLTVRVTRHDHVETVGTEVDRREQFGGPSGRAPRHLTTAAANRSGLEELRRRTMSRNHKSWWRSGCG